MRREAALAPCRPPGRSAIARGRAEWDRGLLGGPFQTPSGNLVDLHHLWRVSKPYHSVVNFVVAHPPRGALKTGSGGGSTSGPGTPTNRTFVFAYPGLPGRVSQRWLDITLVELPGDTTGVRADAQEIWIVPRPRTEVTPRGVRKIGGSVHVVAKEKVARIIRWFNRLPTAQPGVGSCFAEVGPPKTVTLSFRSGSGARLARARFTTWGPDYSLISTRCTPIEFSIRGKRRTPSIGGYFLLRVQHLLGTPFVLASSRGRVPSYAATSL